MGEMKLAEFKEKYAVLAEKHKLPSFEEINKDFDIDRVCYETDFILRMVRRSMKDKITSYLSFLEMLINPVNAPRIYQMYMKSLSEDENKLLTGIYEALGKFNFEALPWEFNSTEEEDAKAIKRTLEVWNESIGDFKKLLEGMKVPDSNESKRERGYFG